MQTSHSEFTIQILTNLINFANKICDNSKYKTPTRDQ